MRKGKIVTYPHFKIEEKEPKKPKTELVHRHLDRLNGSFSFKSTDGKVLTTKFSAKAESDSTNQDLTFLEAKCDVFKIVSGLYCAVWKNNPDKGFFFISGNKKSVTFDQIDLKHAPNRILTVLKYRKKAKRRVLSTIKLE